MKYVLKALVISCLAVSVSVLHADTVKQKSSSKAARHDIHQQHNKHWSQKRHARHTSQFICFDSWGTKIRGKFVRDEKYLIELGGGQCQRFKRRNINNGFSGDISEIVHYDFNLDSVFHAVKEVRRKYGIRNSKFVEAVHVDQGLKTFKYTLVFRVKGQGIREFRVKHDYRSGRIKKIREV